LGIGVPGERKMEIDPERPKSQHLSPEIGQQPMGQGVPWPLWAFVVFIIAAAAIVVWAAGY
jgi:hypothetical protein